MEAPSKRRRLQGSNHQNDLHARRAQNDFRLKSIFESIFEKYGRDFDGIADEIDMETGEIVVNNGHIQGMTNERDIGDAKYSSEKLEDSDYEDDQLPVDHNAELSAGLRSSMVEDAIVIGELKASEHLDFDTDSLMGDVPANSHLNQIGNKSRRAISIPSDDEEDELASSDIERASCSKNSSRVQERFCSIEDNYAFLDEPAVEPIWRAPPLPSMRRQNNKENVGLASADSREHSDDERAGISLWTPEVKDFPQRRYTNVRSLNPRSPSFLCGQTGHADGRHSDSSDSDFAPRKFLRWTQEEDDLLIHLKTTTNLSGLAMEPYFPERQGNTIASHWSYLVSRGKTSPRPQVSTALRSRILLPRSSSRTRPLTLNGTCTDSYDHDTVSKAQNPQIVQQQLDQEIPETGNFVRCSSVATQYPRDRLNSRGQICHDQGKPTIHVVDESILDSAEVEAHTVYPRRDPLSSAGDCGCEASESSHQLASNEAYADADHSCSLPIQREFGDHVSTRKMNSTSKVADQKVGLVSEAGYRARISFPDPSIKTKPDSKGAEPYDDGISSLNIQSRITTAFEAPNWPKHNTAGNSEIQREESVRSTVADAVQKESSVAEGTRKNRSTDLFSTAPLQSPDHSTASHRPSLEASSNDLVTRQIVQVVIPLAARSHVITKRTRSPSATSETALSATAKSEFAVPGLSSLHQDTIAICTPTGPPSVADAESQHAASAAFILDNKKRVSLGPEIADSQPLNTTATVSSPAPEIGGSISRPIILDADSPPPTKGPSVAPSRGKQPKKLTKVIISGSVPQPSCANFESATPVWKQIEEAKESDVVESGSHSLSKTFLAAKPSSSKSVKRKTAAVSFHPIWTAIDDHSEDELSYL